MRAIIVSGSSQLSRSQGMAWGVLSPLVDRPFLQHVVESIVRQGSREIDFVFPGEEQRALAILGDGTRWGARFRYQVSAPSGTVYDALDQIALENADEPVLLALSDRLPLLQLGATTSVPTLFCWREKKLHWTGWGVIRGADLIHLPKGLEEKQLFTFLVQTYGQAVYAEGKKPLSAHSYEDLIEANRRVLGGEFPGLLMGGKEVQPGVWVARNVSVHPTAKLRSPAFLGENSRVGALVQVGPAVSIGKDCMIERETFVSDSVVFGGSYVGQQLELRGVVVDRSRLINTRWGAEIEGVDELLLGSVSGPPLSTLFRRACARVAAAVGLLVAFPCLCAMFVGSALGLIPALKRDFMVRTPTVSDAYRWKVFPLWSFGVKQVPEGREGWLRHFFFCFLPALLSIAAGQMDFAGSRPRTKEEAEQTTASQPSGFLRSRPGLLQPGLKQNAAPQCDLSGTGAADTSWDETIRLMLGYARSVIRNLFMGVWPFGNRRHAE